MMSTTRAPDLTSTETGTVSVHLVLTDSPRVCHSM